MALSSSSVASTFSISGLTGVPGVTLTAGTHATNSTTNGAYVFGNLLPGTYVVAPWKAGCTFTPAFTSVALGTGNATQVDFSATCSLAGVDISPAEETVYSTPGCPDVDADIPDTCARAFVGQDGRVQMLANHFNNFRMVGDNLDCVTRDCSHSLMRSSSPNACDITSYDNFQWLMAPYTLGTSTVHALIHNEYHGWECNNCPSSGYTLACWYNEVNLATSTDDGATFSHAPAPNQVIARSSVSYSTAFNTNLGYFNPSNWLFHNGYFYGAWYVGLPSGMQGTCMVRTPDLADIAAHRFFDGVGFNQPAGAVDCAPVNSLVGINSSLTFNSHLGTFLMLGQSGPNVYLSTSSDLMTWAPVTVVTPVSALCSAGSNCNYFTVIQPGDPTLNFETTARSPWVYYVKVSTTDVYARQLVRRRVRFNLAGDTPSATALYEFNERAGSDALDSAYGNHRATTSNVTWTQDGTRRTASLAGNGSIITPDAADLSITGGITVDAWVRLPAANDVFQGIAVKETSCAARNYWFGISPAAQGGKVHFSLTANGQCMGTLGNTGVADDQWHHVAASFDDVTHTVRFYVDGLPDGESVLAGATLAQGVNTGSLVLGGAYSGQLDRVRIHARVLQPWELRGEYCASTECPP